MKMRQPRNMFRDGGSGLSRGTPSIIDIDNPPRRRRVENSRVNPNDLLPLGDPDDPTLPFTNEITNARISRKIKMAAIRACNGTDDLENHVRIFSNALLLQPVNDAIKCRAFPQILGDMA